MITVLVKSLLSLFALNQSSARHALPSVRQVGALGLHPGLQAVTICASMAGHAWWKTKPCLQPELAVNNLHVGVPATPKVSWLCRLNLMIDCMSPGGSGGLADTHPHAGYNVTRFELTNEAHSMSFFLSELL